MRTKAMRELRTQDRPQQWAFNVVTLLVKALLLRLGLFTLHQIFVAFASQVCQAFLKATGFM